MIHMEYLCEFFHDKLLPTMVMEAKSFIIKR